MRSGEEKGMKEDSGITGKSSVADSMAETGAASRREDGSHGTMAERRPKGSLAGKDESSAERRADNETSSAVSSSAVIWDSRVTWPRR